MNDMISASKIDYYIRVLRGGEHGIDTPSMTLVDELFALLKTVKPCGSDERRELWLTAGRGRFEDFQDYDELDEDEKKEHREEYEQWWLEEYPDETVWFLLTSIEHDGYRAVAVGHTIVVQIDPRRPNCLELDVTPFLQWVVSSTRTAIAKLRDGSYNSLVQAKLPARHRVGTILRKYYWDVLPQAKESNLKGISQAEIDEFVSVMADLKDDDLSVGRLQSMTALRFYECCALGYKANAYAGSDTLSPKELYLKYADGRDEGLHEINDRSPQAFHSWLHDRECCGGHPWEVCRGGNSTHISLYVYEDEKGYCLTLAGSAWNRTVETIKFYLTLVHNDIPVRLMDGCLLAERMVGAEKIGIVPHGVYPAYCSSYFRDEKIITYMNLPLAHEKQLAKYAIWQDVDKQYLAIDTGDNGSCSK